MVALDAIIALLFFLWLRRVLRERAEWNSGNWTTDRERWQSINHLNQLRSDGLSQREDETS